MQKWIRRAHMYLGIALLPWVFMYGFTALLFNHSGWMSETRIDVIPEAELKNSALGAQLNLESLAIAASAHIAEAAGTQWARVEGTEQWSGSYRFVGTNEAESITLRIDPELNGGTLRRRPRVHDAELPDWVDDAERVHVDFADAPEESQVVDAMSQLAICQELELDTFKASRWPAVQFLARHGDLLLECRAGLDGEVEIEHLDAPATLRRKLLRLHVQHGDPGFMGIRRLWALTVDAMGISMILWGLSGLVMWWSIRRTRRAGLVALLAGALGMGFMAVLVWRATGLV